MTTNLVAQAKAWFFERAEERERSCEIKETCVGPYRIRHVHILSYEGGVIDHTFSIENKRLFFRACSGGADYGEALDITMRTMALWEQQTNNGWQPIETAIPYENYLVTRAGTNFLPAPPASEVSDDD
jgi:hypothetical protein